MNIKSRIAIVITLALLAVAVLVAVTWAAPGSISLPGGAPSVVAYQGEVQVSGTPYNGDGYFKFAVVNAAGDTVYWSNNGSSTGGGEPTAAVKLTVSEGLFSVLLGDTALDGMTQALAAEVFSQPNRYLRVWFSTSSGGAFSQLTPDTRIAAVPYALQAQEALDAETVDGLEGAALEESAEIVAAIAAHAAIVDAHHASQLGVDYQNVVVVAKSGGDFTSVQAAITSISDAAADKPYLVWVAPGVYSETVTMKSFVHLQGAGQEATVISSTASSSTQPPQATLVLVSDASLSDLTVGNSGAGDYNAGLLATAGVTRTLVADVTARAQGGGVNNYAIFLTGSGTGVTLQHVSALAENGSSENHGLYNDAGAEAVLRGGSFTGSGGGDSFGIYNTDSGTTLEAECVSVLGKDASSANYGLYNANFASAVLRGGSFTAHGSLPVGINNHGLNTSLEAESVTVLGESGGGSNYGLLNSNGADVVLRGGSFTGRGGTTTYGIYNVHSSTTLETESVSALGKGGTTNNRGLYNYSSAVATLRGGSFIGSGGTSAFGIHNDLSGTLEAESITMLGENGGNNYGLWTKGPANVTQSVLEGATNSVYQDGGSVTISNSRLVGGAKSGTVTCVLVTRGTGASAVSTDGTNCP